jgi:hypothetical protein
LAQAPGENSRGCQRREPREKACSREDTSVSSDEGGQSADRHPIRAGAIRERGVRSSVHKAAAKTMLAPSTVAARATVRGGRVILAAR